MDLLSMITTPLLQHATLLLVLCNETLLCFDSWVYTPPMPPAANKPWPDHYFAHPALTTLAYAVAEPLYAKATLWLSLPAAAHVLTVGLLHTQVLDLCAQGLWRSAIEQHLTAPPANRGDATAVLASEAASDDSPAAAAPSKPVLSTSERLFILHFPVQTAAMTNAALLLFAYSLRAQSMATTPFGAIFEIWFSVLAVFVCLFAGYVTRDYGARTFRPHFFRTLGWNRRTLVQGLYLCLLLLVRLGMRWVLDLDVIPILSMHNEGQANELYRPGYFEWINQFYSRLPKWVRLVVIIGGLVMQWVGLWFQRRELKKNTEKLERLKAARLENGHGKAALEDPSEQK